MFDSLLFLWDLIVCVYAIVSVIVVCVFLLLLVC